MVRVTRLSITDSLPDGSYRTMSFQYGPDRERWYSELTDDGVTSRSTVYAGNYEKVTENGVTREFYYLDGNVIVVKQNGVFTPYLAFTDNLGSVLSIMDEDGLAVFKAEYDAWGKQTVLLNEIGFHRGYTGHEMLPEFDLINMNGRLYDPMIGRFLSPDPYVQIPEFSQNYNRYSYCVNNPLKYRDENGEFFIGFLSGFFRGAFQGQNPFIAGWNAGVNELKISWGLFELDSHKNFWGKTWEFLSRFTWQLPQTLIGFGYAQTSNLAWQVDNVGYWGGATVLSGNNWGKENSAAMTIGNYITGGSDLQPDPNNSIFQHEYGHYLQSQAMGWAYLTRVAIPSLLSASKKDRSHKFQPFEQDANRRAFNYFNENVEGFYQTEKQFSDNLDKGIRLGWDFYSNPLDVTHQGIRGTYYDYYNPQHRALIANLSLRAKWYDYAGWFEGIVGVFGVGIGNGIYYNNNRIIKK